MFGIGGSEWIVIAAVVITLLVVPGVIVFGAGFLLGKKAGERSVRDEDVSAAERTAEPAEPLTPAPADKPKDAADE